jgi:hypothetical protein
VDSEIDYGWQWYRYNGAAGGSPWHAGFGNGGQRLYVMPGPRLVAVIFCGNYTQPDQRAVPQRVFRDFVLAGL